MLDIPSKHSMVDLNSMFDDSQPHNLYFTTLGWHGGRVAVMGAVGATWRPRAPHGAHDRYHLYLDRFDTIQIIFSSKPSQEMFFRLPPQCRVTHYSESSPNPSHRWTAPTTAPTAPTMALTGAIVNFGMQKANAGSHRCILT